MKIQCLECEKKYNINEEKIPIEGCKIKCPTCQNILEVHRPEERALPVEELTKNPEYEVAQAEEEESANSNTKICPFCAEEILEEAIRCKHCKSDLTENKSKSNMKDSGELLGYLILLCPLISSFLIIFWVGSMNLLQSPGSTLTFLGIATIFSTAILTSIEASQLGFGQNKSGKKESGPIVLFFSQVLIWIFAYPYYFYIRKSKGKKNLVVGGILVSIIFTISWFSMNWAIDSRINEIRGFFN